MSRTWNGSTWNGSTWGIDAPPALPKGTAHILLAAEADAAMACVVEGQLQSQLADDWLQQDRLTLTVQADTVPASWTPHALLTATQVVAPGDPATTTLPFGRYRLVGAAGVTARPSQTERPVQAEDWLRAKLIQPWHTRLAGVATLSPPIAAAALLYGYTGQLELDVFGTGAAISSADFVAAGTVAFGAQVRHALLINWTGVAPAGADLLRLTPAGSVAAPPDPDFEASVAATLAGDPDAGGTYVLRLASGAIPLAYNGTDTLQLRYWQDGTGYIGPTLLLSVGPAVADTTTHSATAGGITLTTAGATLTTPLWGGTWEGAIYAVLWMLTGSTTGSVWVTADGALTHLTTETSLPIPADPTAIGVVSSAVFGTLGALHYERTTRWLDFLGELCRPNLEAAGRPHWGLQPCTLTYDADGVLHLRRAAEAWSAGWGWSADAAHPAAVPFRIQVPLTETRDEPEYDHLQLYYPGHSNAGSSTATPPALVAERFLSPPWVSYDPDWERVLAVTLASIGLVDVFAPDGGIGSYVPAYAAQLLDALVWRYQSAARQVGFTLRAPWYYPQLTQLVTLREPRTGIAERFTLQRATTPLRGGRGTWGLGWVAPLAGS